MRHCPRSLTTAGGGEREVRSSSRTLISTRNPRSTPGHPHSTWKSHFNDVIGHRLGDIVGKRAAAEGKTARELIAEMGLLSDEEVAAILSPENLANPHYRGEQVD